MPSFSSVPTPGFFRRRWFSLRFKPVFSLLLVALLAGCKIQVTTPPQGSVLLVDGAVVCPAGQVCVIEVIDTSFDQRYVAQPKPGFIFSHWKREKRQLCGGSRRLCHLYTSILAGTALEPFLASDEVFFLEPVFKPFPLASWRQLLSELDRDSHVSNSFLYSVIPDIATCDEGVLSEGAKNRALTSLNAIRALHELPAAIYSAAYDDEVQQASLVQKANNVLTHFPTEDMNCFTAAAADGAETSNLGTGPQGDPVSDTIGWTNDNNNVSALEEAGHRRWMLSPGLTQVAYGQVNGAAALKVFGFGSGGPAVQGNLPEFVAMPYGIYPWVLVSGGAKPTPWSLSIVPAGGGSGSFDYFRDAQVEVLLPPKDKPLSVHSQHSDTKGFGVANFLSWMVDDWSYDTEYRVRVSNIRYPDGSTGTLDYTVVLDRYNLVDLDYPLEGSDGSAGSTISGLFDSDKDKDSFGVDLAGSAHFDLGPGFFVHLFDDSKQPIKVSSQDFTVDDVDGPYTVVVSPCDDAGLCFIGVGSYSVTITHEGA
jgi:hypothetical protein